MAMNSFGTASSVMRPVRRLIGTLPMIVTTSAMLRLMAAKTSARVNAVEERDQEGPTVILDRLGDYTESAERVARIDLETVDEVQITQQGGR
ncbi:hypothetical protein [Brevibacterium aurantiacum]|uniref:hypothetical protein n=1 Tax=Brevibacterium aurantiacum TaxID=273384 RepID=UPI0016425D2F|nr:hypothetical protein [Brevibacterium aurantiacum]